MDDTTAEIPKPPAHDEVFPSKNEKQETQGLFLDNCIMILKAAKYGPYLESLNNEYFHGQDEGLYAEFASSATPLANKREDWPPHEVMSPSSDPNFHDSGPVSAPQFTRVESPSCSAGAESLTSDSAPVSTDASRLGVDSDMEDDGLITCFCLKPPGGRRMIHCSECNLWLHFSCVKIRKDPNPNGLYTCPRCVERKQTMRKSTRQRALKTIFDL